MGNFIDYLGRFNLNMGSQQDLNYLLFLSEINSCLNRQHQGQNSLLNWVL
jgi:hypothetical protein